MKTDEMIEALITELRCKDGFRRENARKHLVKIGKPAIPILVSYLADAKQHMRWEACKALGSIRDPAAGRALVQSLSDESEEVRWLAAEGLIALGRFAVVPLLEALEQDFKSLFLRQGAHHVLHALEREHRLTAKTKAVLDALRHLRPRINAATAAHAALIDLKASGK
jgi:HEAT repeat protein